LKLIDKLPFRKYLCKFLKHKYPIKWDGDPNISGTTGVADISTPCVFCGKYKLKKITIRKVNAKHFIIKE
jgi:hypothetical protein